MAGNRVNYIIDLMVDDKKLRSQMSSLNWEEILGAKKGKEISSLFAQGTKEAADQIRANFGGINWAGLLGEQEFLRLQQVVSKVVTANAEKLKTLGREGDVSGIQNIINTVLTLGNELKAVKPVTSLFDKPALVKSMSNFMRVLDPISSKIEQLAKEPEKITAAFDRLFNGKATDGVVKVTQGFTNVGEAAGMASVKTNEAIKNMESAIASIEKLFDKEYSININNSDASAKYQEFETEAENISKSIGKLKKQMDGMSSSDPQFESVRNDLINKYQQQSEAYRKMMLANDKLSAKEPGDEDFYAGENDRLRAQIEKNVSRIKSLKSDAMRALGEITQSTNTTKDGINIPIKLPTQADLLQVINGYIDGINASKAVHGIQIGIDPNSANMIKDQVVRPYGNNEGTDDKNTDELVAKTEARFQRIAESIGKQQDAIVAKTDEWRGKMLERFKFSSGDFNFDFNNTLIQELQALFDEYALRINIDREYLANEIKSVLSTSTMSIGGGTVGIDAASINNVISSVLFGASNINAPSSSSDVIGNENVASSTSHIADELEKSAVHLDLAEDYVRDVVNSLKGVAKYALANKQTNGTAATQRRFDMLGLNLKDVANAGDDDNKILSMLEKSLLTRNEFGDLSGSTVVDSLGKFKQSSSKSIGTFISSLNELFFMLREKIMSVDEMTQKQHRMDIFNEARSKTIAAESLRGVRSDVYQDKIPSVKAIENAITLMSSIGANTNSLSALKDARMALGDSTDKESLQTFKTAATEFYNSSTQTFNDLKRQVMQLFQGTVYMRGANGNIVSRPAETYKQMASIKEDAVIVDVAVHSSLNNVALGDVKGQKNKMTTNSYSKSEEERLMRGVEDADYLTRKRIEEGIFAKQLKYDGFKAQDSQTNIDYDKALAANQKRKEALLTDIQTKEAERQSLDQEISILDQRIDALSAKNKAIPEGRKAAAKEEVVSYEKTQRQLQNEIYDLEKEVGSEKPGEAKRTGILTEQINAKIAERLAFEKQATNISEQDVEARKRTLSGQIEKQQEELSLLQQDLQKQQQIASAYQTERSSANADAFRASAALKKIPQSKKYDTERATAQQALDDAQRRVSNADKKIEEVTKDITNTTQSIEKKEQKILSLQNKMSNTTIDSIRQELLDRIIRINSAITQLEEAFNTKMTQKAAKESALAKINVALDEARGAEPLTTQRELDAALSQRAKLFQQRGVIDEQIGDAQRAVDNLAPTNQRLEAEKRYVELKEQSVNLEGLIVKLQADGASSSMIEAKKKELEAVNAELTIATEKLKELGGAFNTQGTTPSMSSRKTYALNQLGDIESDLIIARAQQAAAKGGVSDADKRLGRLEKSGLTSGYGKAQLLSMQEQLTSQFMSSDYVASIDNALREQTKQLINQRTSEINRELNEAVSTKMVEHGKGDPNSTDDVQRFLETYGKRLSEEYDRRIQEMERTLWADYETQLKERMSQLRTDFKAQLTPDNKGVVRAPFKVQGAEGDWIDNILSVDVLGTIKNRLLSQKEYYTQKQQQATADVNRLMADRKAAIEYGGIGESELIDPAITSNLVVQEEKLAKLKTQQAEAQQRVLDLDRAGVSTKDESFKAAQKELDKINEQVAAQEKVIDRRKRAIDLAYQNSQVTTDVGVSQTDKNVQQAQTTTSVSTTSSDVGENGLIGILTSLFKDIGTNIKLDSTDLAKEKTLSAILELLAGGHISLNAIGGDKGATGGTQTAGATQSKNAAGANILNSSLEQTRTILEGVTSATKGTEKSLSGLQDKMEKLGTVNGLKAFNEFKASLLQLQSAKDGDRDGILNDTIQKAQKLVEVFANLKNNRFANLKQFFGPKVKEDATSLLGVMKQIFALTSKTHGDLKGVAGKATQKESVLKNKSGTNAYNAAQRQNSKLIGEFGADKLRGETEAVRQYNKEYRLLIKMYEEFEKKKTLNHTKSQTELQQQAFGVQKLGRQLGASLRQAETLSQAVDKSGFYMNNGEEVPLGGVSHQLTQEQVAASNLKATMLDYLQTLGLGNVEHVKFDKSSQKLTGTLRISKNEVAQLAVQYNEATNRLYAYNKETKESLTGFAAFKKDLMAKGRSVLSYLTYMTSIYRLWYVLRQGVTYVKEIDTALTELKKVTDETEESYERFLDTAAKTSSKVGSTIKELVSSTADWARLNI